MCEINENKMNVKAMKYKRNQVSVMPSCSLQNGQVLLLHAVEKENQGSGTHIKDPVRLRFRTWNRTPFEILDDKSVHLSLSNN